MTTPQAPSFCAATDTFAEGVTLLAEIIRAYSQEAALAGKTELQEAFGLAWPQRARTALAVAVPVEAAPHNLEQDAESGTVAGAETPVEDNSPIAMSRRELFASLFGQKAESITKHPVQPVEPEASPAPSDVPPPDFAAVLATALSTHSDLAEVTRNGELAYHSLPLLSATYAAILADQDDPAKQVAEMVRRASREYPRPVPVDMFEYPPFNFSPEQLQTLLVTLGTVPLWQDIRFVESSAGTVYLYSTLHLDHDYAVFLAERQDVGLTMNP